MASYSIKDIEHLSGIKAHTLRIWEQRYPIFQPQRTDTNIRYYSDQELRLILNVSILIQHGQRIGQIARMQQNEICEQVHKLLLKHAAINVQIIQLIRAMIDLDETHFDNIISTAIHNNGLEHTMMNLIYPFLERIGIMWSIGTVNTAQEHFTSNIIRQKIIAAIDKLTQQPTAQHIKKFLLFLPEGELHEISLLLYSYLLKTRHHAVIYLGANVPMTDLIGIAHQWQPEFIVTILTTVPTNNEIKPYIQQICQQIPHSTFLFSGRQSKYIEPIPNNALIMNNIAEIVQFIEQQSKTPKHNA